MNQRDVLCQASVAETPDHLWSMDLSTDLTPARIPSANQGRFPSSRMSSIHLFEALYESVAFWFRTAAFGLYLSVPITRPALVPDNGTQPPDVRDDLLL